MTRSLTLLTENPFKASGVFIPRWGFSFPSDPTMSKRDELEKISVWLDPETAPAFKAWARTRDGSTSAALRRLIVDAMFAPPLSTGGRRVLSQFSKKLEQAGKSGEDLTELIEHTKAELLRTERTS